VVLVAFVAGAVVFTRWLDKDTIQRIFPPAPVPACVGNDCGSNRIIAEPTPGQAESATPSAAPLVAPRAPAPSAPAELGEIDGGLDDPRRLFDGGGIRADAVALVAPPATVAQLVAPRTASAGDASPSVDASASSASQDASASQTRAPDAAHGVRCGSATCPEGQVCCNASCNTCRPPGATCSQVLCGPISPVSTMCGPNTCNVGEVCCNASCGICTLPGGTCSQQKCSGSETPVSILCGPNTCNVGEVCCNTSCGICTRPGESCRKEPCF
jgi:hypothetical protein